MRTRAHIINFLTVATLYLSGCAPTPETCFTMSSQELLVDEVVQFENCSVDDYRWEWDFGDGSEIETKEEPSHSYEETGTYVVRFTTYSENGRKEDERFDFIFVTADQVLNFSTTIDSWISSGTLGTPTNKLILTLEIPELTADIVFNGNVQLYNRNLSSNNMTALPITILQDTYTTTLTYSYRQGILEIFQQDSNMDTKAYYEDPTEWKLVLSSP